MSQPSSFVNRQIVQKSKIKIFRNWANFFQKPLDFPSAWWYIYIIKRKENKTMTAEMEWGATLEDLLELAAVTKEELEEG